METVPFFWHILSHFILAIAIGFLAGRYFRAVWLGPAVGLVAGFLIDLDHLLEYFLFFGLRFRPEEFLDGYQFLLSGRIYLWFHAWEYLPLLLITAIWLPGRYRLAKAALATAALAGAMHLATDVIINQYPPEHYSLIHRVRVGFAAEKLLTADELIEYRSARRELGR